jgi:hypothetical protein
MFPSLSEWILEEAVHPLEPRGGPKNECLSAQLPASPDAVDRRHSAYMLSPKKGIAYRLSDAIIRGSANVCRLEFVISLATAAT